MSINPLLAYRPTESISYNPKPQSPEAIALWKACQEFEALFYSQLLRAMTSTLNEGMFGSATGSDFYQEMYESELAKAMSKSGGIGIATMLYKQMSPHSDGNAD